MLWHRRSARGTELRRARNFVPEAEFRQADFTGLVLEAESLDAVVALYVFNHVPKADLPVLLLGIAGSLRPGGFLLATFGRSGVEGVQDDWLGVPMFFGSYTDEETLGILRSAGYETERFEVVPIVEPGGRGQLPMGPRGCARPRRPQHLGCEQRGPLTSRELDDSAEHGQQEKARQR